MNKLTGNIVYIESSANMSIVDVEVGGDIFSAVLLEAPQSAEYLKKGRSVDLLFKETEVSVAKNLSGQISLRNRIASSVKRIDLGDILTAIVVDYKGKEIASIISTRSARKMDLKVGDDVEWLVKTNEVSLLHK